MPLIFKMPPTRSAISISLGIAISAAALLHDINENNKLLRKLLKVFLYGTKNPTNEAKGTMYHQVEYMGTSMVMSRIRIKCIINFMLRIF